MEMTIAQGLKKIKLIEKKIMNEIEMGNFLGLKQKGTMTEEKTRLNPEMFKNKANASKQAITKLIENYFKINGAIAKSNAITNVIVAGKSYTVAEAIKRKLKIEQKEKFLLALKQTKKNIEEEAESKNERIKELMADAISKDTEKKDNIKNFYKDEEWEILDPLKINDLIKNLSDEIDEFKSEVDDCLSTSNIKTIIEVDLD